MSEKPHYVIQFSAANCMFEIRVNDIIVITLNLEGQAMTNIPFNYAISNIGKQVITVHILPVFGETTLRSTSEFYYNVLLYDVSGGFNLIENLGGYKAPKINKNKPETSLSNTNKIDANIPFKLNDAWKKGQNLKDIKNLDKKIRNAYQDIAHLIQERDFETLVNRMQIKEANIAKALYLTEEDSKARINSLIMDINDGFNHIDIPQKTVIVYSAYGKIVSLKRPNGEPALSLMNKVLKEEIMLDLDFYLPKNSNEFQII